MANQGATQNDERYLTNHPIAIVQILNELAKNKTTLNLSFNYGQEQGLTTVVGVSADKKSVYMDKSLDAGFNKKLMASDTVVFSKTDGVKIRWVAHKITEVKLKDGAALKIALPKSLYRFQRREFFRSPAPTANPVICYIPYQNPNNDVEEALEMTLADISLGGIGTVVVDHLSPLLEVEKIFERCRITLPSFGDLALGLCVKHISESVMLNGSKKYRVGFQFVNITHKDERVVQNYVMQLEREALVLASTN
ncbi:MAG: flagellar brake protein [Methylophilaceae bacterium]